jgi:hypothetical protein
LHCDTISIAAIHVKDWVNALLYQQRCGGNA